MVNFIDKSDAIGIKFKTLMYNNTVDSYLNANDNECKLFFSDLNFFIECDTVFLSQTLYQVFLLCFLVISFVLMILYEYSFILNIIFQIIGVHFNLC